MAELILLGLTLLAGLVTGAALSIVGIAGSIVAVPLLVLAGVPAHAAVAASAVGMALHSALEMRGQGKLSSLLRWPMWIFCGAGIAAATGAAFVVSGFNDNEVLVICGFAAIAVGIGMMRPATSDSRIHAESAFAISLRLAVAGAIVGFLAGATGAGGGLLVVWGILMSAVSGVAAQGPLVAVFGPMALAGAVVLAVAGLVIWPVTGVFGVAVLAGRQLAKSVPIRAESWHETFAVVSMVVGLGFVLMGAKALGAI